MTVEELEIVIRANITDALKGIKTVTDAVKQAVSESVSPMQQMVTKSKEMANASASSIGQIKNQLNGLKATISGTTAQQQKLIDKINDMKATLSSNETGAFKMTSSEIVDMRAEIEKAEGQLYKLQNASTKSTDNIGKAFQKGIKSVRKFVFSLFAVGSIFSLISRSMREYLTTNEEANARMQASYNVIAQLLAPAMEVLVNVVQYLMIGLALLIKMFTGFDALSKVTTKNINKSKNAVKGLNKELTSMDEITNLSGDGTGLGIAADLSALADFGKKIEEVQALFDKWNVQPFVDKLKDMWDWIVKNKTELTILGTTIGLTFGALKVGGWIKSIQTLIGVAGGTTAGTAAAGTGLAGLASIIGFIAGVGVIAIVMELVYKGVTGKSFFGELFRLFGILGDEIKLNGGFWKTWSNGIKFAFDTVKTWWGDLMSSLQKNWNNFIDTLLHGNKLLNGPNSSSRGTGGGFSSGTRNGLGGGGAFATGGVVSKPYMGLVGEYPDAKSDPEIISPQSIMRQTMIEAFATIAPQMENNGGTTILNINGREFAKAVKSDLDYESNRVGSSTIIRRA